MKMKPLPPRPDRRQPVCPGCVWLLAHQRRYPTKLCPECLYELAEKLRRRG